ncbi:LiaF transmembrane domain-containing protein [Paenibacillus planticolens]|uniref:LiaF transmembrane domain-containing protein n=1 Tax=Paenibacillus planticolens TaxID=2654976 RepID=A0ABX1ZL66_9BACL|nr:hypothetical protein [Paenibacillus planticolens]NOU99601.1 hypothetical protein [Paenibacillus planticolens]
MSMNRSKSWALILIAVGFLILMHKVGMHFHFMGMLVPVAMVGLGYVGIRNGKKIGWVIFGIGALVLITKLSGLIAIGFALWLMYYGYCLLKKQNDSAQF